VPDRVDPRDILVIQPRRRSAFLIEARHRFRIARKVGRQQFERDEPFELGIDRPEDRPHAADTNRLLEPKRGDLISRMWE
jgi:hypothetical protein